MTKLQPLFNETLLVGWREWVAMPELGIAAIEAKVDTGARTSALHAFDIEVFQKNGTSWVRFGVHPLRKRTDIEHYCVAPIMDQRQVTDSGGHQEERWVIETSLCLAQRQWSIEITLTNRDSMAYRMLLGRTTLRRGYLLVDSRASYLTGTVAPIGDDL